MWSLMRSYVWYLQAWGQDEKTSAVDGMPGMVRKAGLADEVLPVDSIADAIVRVTGIRISTD